jgi:hypothetical protein
MTPVRVRSDVADEYAVTVTEYVPGKGSIPVALPWLRDHSNGTGKPGNRHVTRPMALRRSPVSSIVRVPTRVPDTPTRTPESVADVGLDTGSANRTEKPTAWDTAWPSSLTTR